MPWGATPEEQKASPLHAVFGNAAFLADRSKLSGGRPINTEAIRKAQPFLLDQLLSNLNTLEQTLQGSMETFQKHQQSPPPPAVRPVEGGWVLGTVKPSAADVSVFGKIHWLLTTGRAPEYVNKTAYPRVFAWFSQMKAYMKTHAHPTQDRVKLTGEEALEVAKAAAARPDKGFVPTGEKVHAQEKRRVGQIVTVSPNDYGKVPVRGEIVEITSRRVSIRPESLASIEVVLHFPRNGYMILPVHKASL